MNRRGLQLLEAHMRSFDPDEPTARERLAEALGEPLAQTLVSALLSADSVVQGSSPLPSALHPDS